MRSFAAKITFVIQFVLSLMPAVDKPLQELREHYGIFPRPSDFDAYWEKALAELEATAPAAALEPTKTIHPRNAEAFDLWFTGVGGTNPQSRICNHGSSSENNFIQWLTKSIAAAWMAA